MKKLSIDFYRRADVLLVAKELLGKVLITQFEGKQTTGRILEVEAYAGVSDRASHSFGGRITGRNEVMYGDGGKAYVYLCYGIHHLFNVVTNVKEVPQAILIRALEPVSGTGTMLERTGKKKLDYTITRGPGNLSKAMGLLTKHNGMSLIGKEIFLADDGVGYTEGEIAASPRIGVEYAKEDALLPYRFYVKGNPYISGNPK